MMIHECNTGMDCEECPGCETQLEPHTPTSLSEESALTLNADATIQDVLDATTDVLYYSWFSEIEYSDDVRTKIASELVIRAA